MTDFQTTRIKKIELQLLKTSIHRFLSPSLPLCAAPNERRLEKLCSLGCLIDQWAFISRLRRSKAVLPWTTISNGMSETTKKKRKATNARDRSFLAAFDWIEPRKRESHVLASVVLPWSSCWFSYKWLPMDQAGYIQWKSIIYLKTTVRSWSKLVSVFKHVLNRDRSLAVDRRSMASKSLMSFSLREKTTKAAVGSQSKPILGQQIFFRKEIHRLLTSISVSMGVTLDRVLCSTVFIRSEKTTSNERERERKRGRLFRRALKYQDA